MFFLPPDHDPKSQKIYIYIIFFSLRKNRRAITDAETKLLLW